MNSTFFYRPELHIAGVRETEPSTNPIRVLTLLQCPGKPQAAINAYLAARYSRSADSVEKIAEEVIAKGGAEASERLSKIFHGYGHASVGDQAVITVCVENVTQFTAHKIFNFLSANAGQERSTRYQNFGASDNSLSKAPSHWPFQLQKEYERVMQRWSNYYNELHSVTREALKGQFDLNDADITAKEKAALESRTLDTLRYFIPLGSKTSLAVIASARTFSSLISFLKGSNQRESQQVGELTEELLSYSDPSSEYVAEAGTLIRHVEPRRNSLIKNLLDFTKEDEEFERVTFYGLNGTYVEDTIEIRVPQVKQFNTLALLHHIHSLSMPKMISFIHGSEYALDTPFKYPMEELAEILFQGCDRHNPIGNLGQSGAVSIEGLADIGTLRDLNRHRSLERWLPYLDDNYNLIGDLFGPSADYALCPYLHLDFCKELKREYEECFNENYVAIRMWIRLAEEEAIPAHELLEYGRYMLPLAHQGQYFLYGSIDDLQYIADLRTRPGGHIQYRLLVKAWIKKLVREDAFWRPLYNKLPDVDAANREQFLDRS